MIIQPGGGYLFLFFIFLWKFCLCVFKAITYYQQFGFFSLFIILFVYFFNLEPSHSIHAVVHPTLFTSALFQAVIILSIEVQSLVHISL